MTVYTIPMLSVVLALTACHKRDERRPPVSSASVAGRSTAAPRSTGTTTAVAAQQSGSAAAHAGATALAGLRGRWGFDWFHPETAKCLELDDAAIKRLMQHSASCRPTKSGDFGGIKPGEVYTCKSGESSEWLVYRTKAICEDQRATMEANAP